MLSPQQLLKSSKLSRTANESWIQDLDPLLQGNMKPIYTKTISVEIRQVDEQGRQIGTKAMLTFRFFVRQTADSQYSELNVEINNDADLFFVYVARIDQKRFEKVKKQQGINFPFGSLLAMLVKQLQLCDKQLTQYSAIFYLNPNSNPRLDFIENIEYKRIELISFQFQQLPQQLLKDYITYRFTKLKKTNQLMVAKIRTVMGEVKLKNPKLLKSLLVGERRE